MKIARTVAGLLFCGLPMLAPALPPSNDGFAQRLNLTGFPVRVTGSNTTATLELNEPLPAEWSQESPAASVWFSWTAPSTRDVRIDLEGSDPGMVLALWSGGTLTNLNLFAESVRFNDGPAAIYRTVTSGSTYRIAVYGNYGAEGNLILSITNDTRARILGRVTTTDGVTPLPGIEVTTYRSDPFSGWIESADRTSTMTDGTYEVRGLEAGSYTVEFRDAANENYIREFYEDQPDLWTANAVEVAAGASVTGIHARLAVASSISGLVTGPIVNPLADILVEAYRVDPVFGFLDFVTDTRTTTAGTYRIGGLATGTYRLSFSDPTGETYLQEVYDNQEDLTAGSNLVLAAAEQRTGVNITLDAGAIVTGRVTGPDGATGIEGVSVTLFTEDPFYSWTESHITFTTNTGGYALRLLRGGTYRMRFSGPGEPFVPEFFDSQPSIASALDINLSLNEIRTNISASLQASGAIAGRVSRLDGVTPLEFIYAAAYVTNPLGGWDYVAEGATDIDGLYTINGVTSGTYRVQFTDPYGGLYVSSVYSNQVSLDTGNPVPVTTGQTTSNINARLLQVGSIAGRVTGPGGAALPSSIRVDAFATNDLSTALFTQFSEPGTGTFILTAVAPGTYRLLFTDESGLLLTRAFSNALTLATGRNVVVGDAQAVTSIVQTLPALASIGGRVTETGTTNGLAGILVESYLPIDLGGTLLSRALTGSNGSYSVFALTGTPQIVTFTDTNLLYLSRIFSNQTSFADGTPILLPSPANLTNVNQSVPRSAIISGRVTTTNGVTPLAGIRVTGYDGVTLNPFIGVTTDTNGFYQLRGFSNGLYRIGFTDTNFVFAPRFYSNALSLETAADLALTNGELRSGADIRLFEGAVISGRLSAAGTSAPIDNALVSIAQDDGSGTWMILQSSMTDINGGYRFSGLAAGTYRMEFMDFSGRYLNEVFNNATTYEEGTDIQLNYAEIRTIHAELDRSARIRGTVYDPGGVTGVPDIEVRIERLTASNLWQQVEFRYTQWDGSYDADYLREGTYRVRFMTTARPEYADGFYQGKPFEEEATPIILTAGDDRSGVDAVLSLSAGIGGIVTAEADAPVAFFNVQLIRTNATGAWVVEQSTTTDINGSYHFDRLPAARYRMWFSHFADYASVAWSNAPLVEYGEDIVVFGGESRSNINVRLLRDGGLFGVVTNQAGPIDSAVVTAYRSGPAGWIPVQTIPVDGTAGYYQFHDLLPGSYRLMFYDLSGDHRTEFWEDVTNEASASSIIVLEDTLDGPYSASLDPVSDDADADGIPDWWEVQYFGGTNPTNGYAANGIDTLREAFLADLDPTQPTSIFPRAAVSNPPPGRMILVIAPSSTGRVYGVVWNTNLLQTPQDWTLVPPEQTGSGSSLTFTITNEMPGRIYRTTVRLPE